MQSSRGPTHSTSIPYLQWWWRWRWRKQWPKRCGWGPLWLCLTPAGPWPAGPAPPTPPPRPPRQGTNRHPLGPPPWLLCGPQRLVERCISTSLLIMEEPSRSTSFPGAGFANRANQSRASRVTLLPVQPGAKNTPSERRGQSAEPIPICLSQFDWHDKG